METNMKIALCLSGQPRFIDEGYEQLYDNLLSKYSVDCFIHSWWSSKMANVNINTMEMANPSDRSYIFKQDTVECIQKYYNPISFIYEPQKQFEYIEDVDYKQPNKTISVQSMWYSIKKSNELKNKYENENNFKYNIVIRSRTDIKIHKFILDELVEKNCVYTDYVGKMEFPNDQFAVSDSDSSNYYASLYDNLITYKNEGFKLFVGEHLLKYHMEKSNIKLCYTPLISNDIFKTI
jgi:hypothetical protein